MKRTIVVGAGAVGLGCAYALRRRGRDVIVLDRGQPGQACTRGNAGWITPSISGPIPAPGLTWTSLKWMLRSDSPLYISPRAVPSLSRWLWRFWRHCNQRDFVHGLRATAELNRRTFALFDQLEREGVEFELHRQGLLYVFLDERYLRAALQDFPYYKEYGYDVPEPLSAEALRREEPSLSARVKGGFLVPQEYHVRPETLARGYAERLAGLGVEIRPGVEVTGLVRRQDIAVGVETAGGLVEGDSVLVAAGAWSGQVIEGFGVSLPVQAGKGYSITFNGAGPQLKRPLYLGEAKVGCSPFEGAVRFAGTMELSGVNTVLDPRRVVGIRRGIQPYFDLDVQGAPGEEWVGMRPLTPDGLPLLGRVPGHRNLFVATGHAMLGITLAPVTGEVMADLITEAVPDTQYAAFEPGRFRW